MVSEEKLQVGEPYFNLSADAEKLLGKAMRALQNGHKNVYIPMFINKNKSTDDDPAMIAADRLGAVWKKTKKQKSKAQNKEGEVDMTQL